jgi:hypothetical protein
MRSPNQAVMNNASLMMWSSIVSHSASCVLPLELGLFPSGGLADEGVACHVI